jgi:hypothetical protein
MEEEIPQKIQEPSPAPSVERKTKATSLDPPADFSLSPSGTSEEALGS